MRGLLNLTRGAFSALGEMSLAPPPAPWRTDGEGVGRRLDAVRLPLDRLRRLKAELGVSLNDVILALLAGALARHHGRHGPAELSCMVPMSLRLAEERGQLGNRVGGFVVHLPIAERDPLVRLQRIHAQTAHAKSNGTGSATQYFMRAAALVPAPIFRAVAQRVSGRVQVICSNVPGPPARRYLAGARIDAVHPFAPVMRGTPLSLALLSYGDTVGIGIDTDPTVIADPARLGRAIERAVDEIERRAARRRPERAAAPPARRAARQSTRTGRRSRPRSTAVRR
jgi:WS/DGAT/MGAT family acyltransferase